MATCKSSGYQVACDGELFWDDYGGTDACCPTGQVCCDEEGYCCDPDFTALHVGLSIPIFVFAALQIGVALLRYSAVGSKRTALLCFGIGNFIFWFLVGLGVTPLCGEDVTGRAQKTSGDDYKWWYSTYFSPEGDCTTNLIICWSVAGGIAFFTFVGALCRVRVPCCAQCMSTLGRGSATTPPTTARDTHAHAHCHFRCSQPAVRSRVVGALCLCVCTWRAGIQRGESHDGQDAC